MAQVWTVGNPREARRRGRADGRTELVCRGCGYAVAVTAPAARCPRCRGSSWRIPGGAGRAGRAESSRPAPSVQLVDRAEDDVERLFGLAKQSFGEMHGWSDARVLGQLRRDPA